MECTTATLGRRESGRSARPTANENDCVDTFPSKLERRDDDSLLIEWSDGERRLYTVRELRDACPCATCRNKPASAAETASLLPVLSAEEAQPLRIKGMQPVGQYAYTIAFSDGHDTGIYSFELLRSLGEVHD